MLQMGFLCSRSAPAPRVFLNRWNKSVLRPKMQPSGLRITADWPFHCTQQPNHHLRFSGSRGLVSLKLQSLDRGLHQHTRRSYFSPTQGWLQAPGVSEKHFHFVTVVRSGERVRKERMVTKLYCYLIGNHNIASLHVSSRAHPLKTPLQKHPR